MHHLWKVAVSTIITRPATSGNGSELLLMRRQNTGHEDGKLDLPSGHAKKGESPVDAAIREVLEETGIIVPSGRLELVRTQFTLSDTPGRDDYIFLYFLCPLVEGKVVWKGEPVIGEPDKCSEVVWWSWNDCRNGKFPDDLISYVRTALSSPTPWSTCYYPPRA